MPRGIQFGAGPRQMSYIRILSLFLVKLRAYEFFQYANVRECRPTRQKYIS